MADDIDLANDLIDNAISRALSEIRKSTAIDPNASPFCAECGDNIPTGRKKLGFKLCVPCAEDMERKKQLYAG